MLTGTRSETVLKETANAAVRTRPVVRSIAGAVAEAEVKCAHFFAAPPPATKRAHGFFTCAQLSGDCGMRHHCTTLNTEQYNSTMSQFLGIYFEK